MAEGGPEKTAALGRPGATPHKDSRIRDFEFGVKKISATEAWKTRCSSDAPETFLRLISLSSQTRFAILHKALPSETLPERKYKS